MSTDAGKMGNSAVADYVLGEDGFPLGLLLHVAAGASAGDTCLLDALGVVAHESCVDDVLAGLAAELALIVFGVDGHVTRISVLD